MARDRKIPSDAEAVRTMIDELAAHGLVRLYQVHGVKYVAVIDWEQLQRVGKRARRRFPADPPRCRSSSI